MLKRLAILLSLICCMVLLFTVNAYAYLDPSAMTYVIQAVAGVIIAGGAAIIIYWRKIKLFFKKNKSAKRQAMANGNESATESPAGANKESK